MMLVIKSCAVVPILKITYISILVIHFVSLLLLFKDHIDLEKYFATLIALSAAALRSSLVQVLGSEKHTSKFCIDCIGAPKITLS